MSKLFIFSLSSLLLGYSIGIYVGMSAPAQVSINNTLVMMWIR